MSEQTAATLLEEPSLHDQEGLQTLYWLGHRVLQHFEYLRYVETDILTLKGAALALVLLLLLRILWVLIPLFCPSRDLRQRAYQKKQN